MRKRKTKKTGREENWTTEQTISEMAPRETRRKKQRRRGEAKSGRKGREGKRLGVKCRNARARASNYTQGRGKKERGGGFV